MSSLTLRIAVRAKVVLERLGLRPRADVYVGFARGWRYPAHLIRTLRCAGGLVLEVPRDDLWLVAREGGLLDVILRTRTLPSAARPTAPVVIDREPTVVAPACPVPVTLSIAWFSRPLRPDTIAMPYFKHPSMWRFDADLGRLADSSRSIRIGFAGTSNRNAYRAAFSFPVLSRSDILEHVVARPDACAVRSQAGIDEVGGAGEIVLVMVEDPTDTTSKHLLQGREYLGFLAQCSFFLAAPGFAMPLTHGLVEAMSVGTIPILNYGEMLTPPLEHGVTCLTFTSLADLDSAIEIAQSLSEAELERMRRSVLQYYRLHLSPEGFAEQLKPFLARPFTLLVNDEGNSVAMMDA